MFPFSDKLFSVPPDRQRRFTVGDKTSFVINIATLLYVATKSKVRSVQELRSTFKSVRFGWFWFSWSGFVRVYFVWIFANTQK